MAETSIKDIVREKYGEAARRATTGGRPAAGARLGARRRSGAKDPITSNLYDASQTLGLPAAAVQASLGCGNPTALAELHEGETVLDLGSGGGIDVLLSSRRVGPAGQGLRPRHDGRHARPRAGEPARWPASTNVEFLKGELESIPLPDGDRRRHHLELRREPLGRQGPRARRGVPRPQAGRPLRGVGRRRARRGAGRRARKNVELWIGCLAGALEEKEFEAKLTRAGFTGVEIVPTRIYTIDDARDFLSAAGIDADAMAPQVDGKFMSAFVRATKPAKG